MPFVTHRGQRIHYDVEGRGETVVFQHGLFAQGLHFGLAGYVPRLVGDHRVVWIDSLGHGDSDKPADAHLYSLEQRAGDVLAVLDALGAERAHFVGYSMGAWIGSGVALHHPERLASLTLGGWDPLSGPHVLLERLRGPDGMRALLELARARFPALVEWVTPEVEPALAACWDALFELEGVAGALAALRCPVLLWSGVADGCYAGAKACAERYGFEWLETPGDHALAFSGQAATVVARLRALFARARARG